jgi:hypothetical protein
MSNSMSLPVRTGEVFRCYEARLHTLPDAPTFRAANDEQLAEHSHRLEALNADKIVPRFGADPDGPDEECNFFENGCHGMLWEEDKWQQCNLVWSWIDERPVWTSPVDWDLEILPNPGHEVDRRFRFSLLGGGQITVIEHFERWIGNHDPLPPFWCLETSLRVTADPGDRLRRFTGKIEMSGYEMRAKAVLFLPRTPQSIADRVAATFRLLTYADGVGASTRDPDRDNFMALLDHSEQCCVCGRALKDHVSTLLGIGPDCARQLRLPHSLDAANRILQRRKQLLGA